MDHRPLVSDEIADVLASRRDTVFGLMGNGNAYLISNLTRRGVPFVSARHESGAVAMADAYYRACGRAGIATTTYGAGFTNTLTALAEAKFARIPLVLIAGDAPSSGLRQFDVDQRMLAEGIGISTLHVSIHNAATVVRRAFRLAETQQTPVIVGVPLDVGTSVSAPAQADVGHDESSSREALDESSLPSRAELHAIADVLLAARRPLVVAGRGVHESGAAHDLRAVGDVIGAAFATSVMARNVFRSPHDIGIAGGFAMPGALELMRDADVVLVVGASLNAFQLRYGTLLTGANAVIQIDRALEATSAAVTTFVHADAAWFAEQLRDILYARTASQPHTNSVGWRERCRLAAPDAAPTGASERAADGRLDPRPFARRLDEIIPENRTIVQDGGHFLGWMPMYARVTDPGGLIMSGTAYQAIGLGFPSAVGASCARPDSTTVLVSGDGGGLMALPDFETLIRQARSCVVIVFNDAAYGAELHQYEHRGLDSFAMLIDEVNFAAIGLALGARGAVKAGSLADLEQLRSWVSDGAEGTFVVDLPVSRSIVAAYMAESVSMADQRPT